MSVVKSKRSHGELEVLTKARDFKNYVLMMANNPNSFPKKWRWSLTNDFIKEACELCRLIVSANAIRLDKNEPEDASRRLLKQNEAYELTEVILEDLDSIYAVLHIKVTSVEYMASMIDDIQGSLKGWMRSDKKRLLG